MTGAAKHRPLPEIPSSQDVHPLEHCSHVGPKKPDAQDSHEVPLNPVGQVHDPEAEQTPDPEHGGEQAVDCMPTRDREPADPDGSWLKSGMESQRMTRLLEFKLTASHILEARNIDSADNGVDTFPIEDVGRGVNKPGPE
jgi:hypothetical protein